MRARWDRRLRSSGPPGVSDGLYVKARAMEAAKYATRHAVVREEGGDERRSPRLAEAHVTVA